MTYHEHLPRDEPMRTIIKCSICGTTTHKTDEDGEWTNGIPTFYDGEKELGPCCPACVAKHLEKGKDGEYQLKPYRN